MRRLLRAAVLVLVFGQVTGIWVELGGDACEVGCEDDEQGATCPPSCACSCTMRAAPMVAVRTTASAPAPTVSRVAPPPREAAPASPDPSEILHVPRSTVA